MQSEYEGLGRMTRAELSVMVVFFGTALLWIFRPLLGVEGLSDSGIAVASALVLFALPADKDRRIMDWESMMQVPWGILLLFGGGLSLARAIEVNKVGEFLGYQATLLAEVPLIVLIIIITASVVFLTELTSNTATTATLLPVLSGVALGASIDPMMLLVPTAIAASCAFMMPVATPPNAVVFGSGRVSIQEMSKAGVYLNFLAIGMIVLVVYLLVPRVLS
jgi:sodium-dependent dicarboxylate transporter 2/3/5